MAPDWRISAINCLPHSITSCSKYGWKRGLWVPKSGHCNWANIMLLADSYICHSGTILQRYQECQIKNPHIIASVLNTWQRPGKPAAIFFVIFFFSYSYDWLLHLYLDSQVEFGNGAFHFRQQPPFFIQITTWKEMAFKWVNSTGK